MGKEEVLHNLNVTINDIVVVMTISPVPHISEIGPHTTLRRSFTYTWNLVRKLKLA
jgi:hypothetical protein